MKKVLPILLVLLLAMGMAACRNGGNIAASPSPGLPGVSISPGIDGGADPLVTDNGSTPGSSPSGGGANVMGIGGDITGFEEGKLIEQSTVPEITKAVMEEFPDAVIKSIVYATHEGRQAYRITMDNADSTEVYVAADGSILGPVATPVESPSASGSPAA